MIALNRKEIGADFAYLWAPLAIVVIFFSSMVLGVFFLISGVIELPSACANYQKWNFENMECYDPGEFRSTIDTLQQTQGTDQVAASQVASITGNSPRLVVSFASEADYYCWKEQITHYCSTKKGGTE